jgi:hypothetical protein
VVYEIKEKPYPVLTREYKVGETGEPRHASGYKRTILDGDRLDAGHPDHACTMPGEQTRELVKFYS